jgi:hypothetical protein
LSPGSNKSCGLYGGIRKPKDDLKGEIWQSTYTLLPFRVSENLSLAVMESFLLEGAPDGSIGTQEEKTSAVQVMHLELNNDILDDLLECIRKGKAPQVLFGKTAVCSRS